MKTNILDRTTQPEVHGIALPRVVEYTNSVLPNGVQFHYLRGGTQPITKIDIVNNAGARYCDKTCVAAATNTLVAEGTRSYTAKQVAEQFDYCGAYIGQKGNGYNSMLTFAMMSKHAEGLLPVIEEIIKEATFSQHEFETYVDKQVQELAINQQTPSYVAKCNLRKLIYAEGSRYCRMATEEAYRAMTTDDLRAFYDRTYTPEGMHIFVSGQPSDREIDLIAQRFSDMWKPVANIGDPELPAYRPEPSNIFAEMPQAQQVSICMGQRFLKSDDDDLYAVSVLDTIFGGYFGSRLMQNIREEKGLTYGIGSSMSNSKYAGLHVIGSEVRPDKADLVIEEIGNEMRTLRTKLVSDEELETVRNYMKGNILRQFDSVLAAADTMSNMMVKGNDASHVAKLYDVVSTITPEQIRDLANKYLWPERYCISMAGKK